MSNDLVPIQSGVFNPHAFRSFECFRDPDGKCFSVHASPLYPRKYETLVYFHDGDAEAIGRWHAWKLKQHNDAIER